MGLNEYCKRIFKLQNVLLQWLFLFLTVNINIFSYNLSTINFILFFSIRIFTEIINFPFLLRFLICRTSSVFLPLQFDRFIIKFIFYRILIHLHCQLILFHLQKQLFRTYIKLLSFSSF